MSPRKQVRPWHTNAPRRRCKTPAELWDGYELIGYSRYVEKSQDKPRAERNTEPPAIDVDGGSQGVLYPGQIEDFDDWLSGAKPNERFLYQMGHYRGDTKIGRHVRQAADAGLVVMVQKRSGAKPRGRGREGCGAFKYYAIRTRKNQPEAKVIPLVKIGPDLFRETQDVEDAA